MKYTEAMERLLALLRNLSKDESPRNSALSRHLTGASPYYWEWGPCSLVQSASRSLRGWSFYPDCLPTSKGFMWFERPFPITGHPYCSELQALSWAYPSRTLAGAVDIVGWFEWIPHEISLPVPCLISVWPTGDTIEQQLTFGGAVNQRGESVEDKFEDKVIRDLLNTTFAASMAFLGQRILVTRSERPDRASRRRLEREAPLHDSVVRVVELRKKEVRDRPDGDSEPVDWHCRWLVSGHWRQQWFPALQRHQPVWITPYVKGPEDKPLKEPAAKVFAVVR